MHPGSHLTFREMLISDQLPEAASVTEADVVIFCEYLEEDLDLIEGFGLPINRRVILLMEPSVVLPLNFSQDLKASFGHVIEVGRPGKLNEDVILWPQYWRKISDIGRNREKAKIVMVAGNKISFVPGELYSLRREVAHQSSNIALYGTEWDMKFGVRVKKLLVEAFAAFRAGHTPELRSIRFWFTSLDSWCGRSADKNKTLENYMFSLVIENSAEFLSEKLFDSFFAGCIPIYVGPDISKFGIPSTLVVTASPDTASIINAIETAQNMDYPRWFAELEMWLNDEQTKKKWSTESFFSQLTKRIIKIHNQIHD